MSLKIDIDIPAGNIFIEDIRPFEAVLAKDLRNTEGDWFYWQFRAAFDEPGKYTFRIGPGPAIGSRGPAFSLDGGDTWQWLGIDSVSRENGDSFSFEWNASMPERIIFCTGMQYLQKQLDEFVAKYASSPFFEVSELARTRKNRPVTLIKIDDPSIKSPKRKLFFTSRHHACEMMATYALEGVLSTMLANDDTGRAMRENFTLYAVPFADTDGVIDGDQGKNRRPHDHARDYGPHPIYPEIIAIMRLIEKEQPALIMDMHCPWLYGHDSNETVYFVGQESKKMEKAMVDFARILEKNAPEEAPVLEKDIIFYGVGWNGPGNYTSGKTLCKWACELPFVKATPSMEIPYANAREKTFTTDIMRKLGRAIAESTLEYMRS